MVSEKSKFRRAPWEETACLLDDNASEGVADEENGSAFAAPQYAQGVESQCSRGNLQFDIGFLANGHLR